MNTLTHPLPPLGLLLTTPVRAPLGTHLDMTVYPFLTTAILPIPGTPRFALLISDRPRVLPKMLVPEQFLLNIAT